MHGRVEAMKRRMVARRRIESTLAAAQPWELPSQAAGEPPSCELDAWLAARLNGKKPPLTAEAGRA